MPPYRQRSGGSPRARCGSLCAWRGPPAVLSGRRFGSVGCGARRLRGPQRLRALPSPPRHFKWGRGCGAARDGGNEGFRRLRAAGERHPSWVSRAHPSLPLRRIYHFIDSLNTAMPCPSPFLHIHFPCNSILIPPQGTPVSIPGAAFAGR